MVTNTAVTILRGKINNQKKMDENGLYFDL